jgi:hypothetical protein
MNKKLLAVIALVALVGSGAFAELALGVTGALHMDQQLDADTIKAEFESGQNIFYGPFVELIGKKMSLGLGANFSFYTDTLTATEFVTYDVTANLGYHLFGGHAFLDPFGELGFGVFATDYANEADDNDPDNPLSGSMYWNAGIGLGLNLGPIGIFGKFSYNFIINQAMTYQDESGNSVDLPAYRYDDAGNPTVPPYRFTVGAKLIL